MGLQRCSKIGKSVQDPARSLAVTAELLTRWFDKNARDLPWRRTQDPYAVWISEVMLQQTQVQTVIPYWGRWMDNLPRIRDLAEAPPERVLKLWEGLGYYSRARNLQRAACQILEEHNGVFPQDPAAILSLPGIGRYTAGAIASIALDQPEPILDGNVIRVLTRFFALEGDP
ncbi:MAG: A/G-specific adenine glycosylase, partial [Pedosphaera sp.]|nr:A/G-specific adenine glycosylase [Pedosphaera sp.]